MNKICDDIFAVWDRGLTALKDFLLKIYKEDNKIQFTVEILNNNTFPFLDILLVKEGNIIN